VKDIIDDVVYISPLPTVLFSREDSFYFQGIFFFGQITRTKDKQDLHHRIVPPEICHVYGDFHQTS
jgi:hypothetical protein